MVLKDMKKGIVALFLLVVALSAFGQTQRGFVKTKGRMVNGQYVKGAGLPGATVSIQGGRNVAVQQADGSFAFPVTAQTFRVQGVQKKGYELVDQDVTRKSYQLSSNPIYLVMETPEQQQQDQLAAERRIRRTLTRKLQDKEDEIENLKALNKLSQEEYQKALQQLYAEQQSNERLIKNMAEEYATMDYDQMDSLNRKISDAIVNGRLTEADSLLRSKGDVSARIAEVRHAQQAEAEAEAELAQRQQDLEASKDGTRKKLNDIARDCSRFFERFGLENQHDSAAYYMELKANLDTTIGDWQLDAAIYFHNRHEYAKAEKYYKRSWPIFKNLSAIFPTFGGSYLTMIQNNLGYLYKATERYAESEAMFKEALEWRRSNAKKGQYFEQDLSETLRGLADLYCDTERQAEAEALYREALEIVRRLVAADPGKYEGDVTVTLNNLAVLYTNTERYAEGEAMFLEALEMYRRLVATDPVKYEYSMAYTLSNLAFVYMKTQRLQECETTFLESLEIYRRLAERDPQTFNSKLYQALSKVQQFYSETQRPAESEAMYNEMLEVLRRMAAANPERFNSSLDAMLFVRAGDYKASQRYAESEALCREALEIRRRMAAANPEENEQALAGGLTILAELYQDTRRYSEAEPLYLEALEIQRRVKTDDTDFRDFRVVLILTSLAELYAVTQRVQQCEVMYREALEILRRLSAAQPKDYGINYIETLRDLAQVYSNNNRIAESEALYQEALEYGQRMIPAEDGLRYHVAISHNNLGFLYVQDKQYEKAITHLEEARRIFDKLSEEHSSYQEWLVNTLYYLGWVYSMTQDYPKSFAIYEELLPKYKALFQGEPETWKTDYVSSIGAQSFVCIMVKEFSKSEDYAREALSMDSTQHWIATNLAAALLFQGKYAEAEEVYRQYKDELKDNFLADLQQMAEAGVIPKEREEDVERIRKMLIK